MLRLPQELWLCILEHLSLAELVTVYHAGDTLGQDVSQVATTQATKILYKLFATGTPKVHFEAFGDEKCQKLDWRNWTDVITSRLANGRPNPSVPTYPLPGSVSRAEYWTPFEDWRVDLEHELLERKMTRLSKYQVAMSISHEPDWEYVFKQSWKACQFGAAPTRIQATQVNLTARTTSTHNCGTQLLQLYYTPSTYSENIIRDRYPFDAVSQVRSLERELQISKAHYIETDKSRVEFNGTQYIRECDLPACWLECLGESIRLSLEFYRDVRLPDMLTHRVQWARTIVGLTKVEVLFKEIVLPTNTELLKLFEGNVETNDQVSQD